MELINLFRYILLRLDYTFPVLHSQVINSPFGALTIAYHDKCHLQCKLREGKDRVSFIFGPAG